ncbi:uncharacterized protein BcabD6B2_39750 [Babesia caballi]|uniref:Uncharacterized protein n=1 Tax=Babesia caballi TaxID=5871 RepID=A0AAV4LXB4_BABCB|nr:hypothetical protein BcabD6B2_39750 [Babesia caballi]
MTQRAFFVAGGVNGEVDDVINSFGQLVVLAHDFTGEEGRTIAASIEGLFEGQRLVEDGATADHDNDGILAGGGVETQLGFAVAKEVLTAVGVDVLAHKGQRNPRFGIFEDGLFRDDAVNLQSHLPGVLFVDERPRQDRMGADVVGYNRKRVRAAGGRQPVDEKLQKGENIFLPLLLFKVGRPFQGDDVVLAGAVAHAD